MKRFFRTTLIIAFSSEAGVGAFIPRTSVLTNSSENRNLKSARDPENDSEKQESHDSIGDLRRRELLIATALTGATLGTLYNNHVAFPTPTTNSQDRLPVPFSSFRRYKSVKLSNGMQVLLVSDKAARQSSAALSIGGAGQFSDSPELLGSAHLMEHMILSNASRRRGNGQDFDEWLTQSDGFSNGFTAYEKVCFHFNCPTEVFPEALERFSQLFMQETIRKTLENKEALKREIRRIDSEIDTSNDFMRDMYLIKSLVNPQHPYSKMNAGNIQTLETLPAELAIDVGDKLFEFFTKYYVPIHAILVVISPTDLSSLESWVSPFSSALSRRRSLDQVPYYKKEDSRVFPELFTKKNAITTICLFRREPTAALYQVGDKTEKLSFHWPLSLNYSGIHLDDRNVVTATQLGFVLSQILGRRGPGSLYRLLRKRSWTPDGTKGVPRISFPVDVSGFQLMKLEFSLTPEGFTNRSSVIAAVYDSINSLAPFQIRRELLCEYMTVAELFGHVLAPRPPDAVELAFDGQLYGVDRPAEWRRLPLPQDIAAVLTIQKCLKETLKMMSDPSQAIISATASQRAIMASKNNLFDGSLPPMSPASWEISPITGARFYNDDMFRLSGRVNEWLVARLMEDELQPPVLNPLIPPVLRPARKVDAHATLSESNYYLSDIDGDNGNVVNKRQGASGRNSDRTESSSVRDYWAVLRVISSGERKSFLPLPRVPPEPSCRCVFVLQLLSTRPARARLAAAAAAELWKTSLDFALSDLAELGAPAGCAYEISFNKYGLRVCFLGLSQNIASYARRLSRRIVEHQAILLEGPERFPSNVVEASIRNANRVSGLSPRRRMQTVSMLRESSAIDSAVEAIAFMKSCRGGVCFSEGDLLPKETINLLLDLKTIFKQGFGKGIGVGVAVPKVEDIIYRPTWIPRSASSCTVSGSSLISDACGRVPR